MPTITAYSSGMVSLTACLILNIMGLLNSMHKNKINELMGIAIIAVRAHVFLNNNLIKARLNSHHLALPLFRTKEFKDYSY